MLRVRGGGRARASSRRPTVATFDLDTTPLYGEWTSDVPGDPLTVADEVRCVH